MHYKIGIVEDDRKLASLLKAHLTRYGLDTWVCEDFSTVAQQVIAQRPQLLLLDITLPCYDGFFWCKKIRRESNLPILFISSRNLDQDQVYAIECGGDDYITKPFSYEIVMAKINAALRRVYGEYAQNTGQLEAEGVVIHTEAMKLTFQGQSVSLTRNERDLLAALFQAYPNAVKRSTLLELLWDSDVFVEENTLNVNIGRARKRLREGHCPLRIKTIRTLGYLLEKTDDENAT